MKFFRIFSAVAFVAVFASCNGGESPEKQADKKLLEIEQTDMHGLFRPKKGTAL